MIFIGNDGGLFLIYYYYIAIISIILKIIDNMKKQFFIHEIQANFNLRNPKSISPTIVYFVVRINGKQVKFSTGLKVYPSQWNKRKQMASIGPNLTPLDNKNNDLLNTQILSYRAGLERFKMHVSQNWSDIDHPELLLRQFIFGEKTHANKRRHMDIIGQMKKVIMNVKNIKPSTRDTYLVELSPSSDSSFPAFLKHIHKTDMDFSEINHTLLKRYETFLFGIVKKSGEPIMSHTVRNKLSKLLAILSHCANQGLLNPAQIDMYKKPRKEKAELGIFLTDDEVERIYHMNLPARLHLARDILVYLCHTGQRFSDLEAMNKNGILIHTEFGDSIRYISTKENNEVIAPLLGYAKEIFQKYGRVPTGSIISILAAIKEVGRLAGLNRTILRKEVRGGQVIVKQKKAYELIGTHTGRRTFINNMLLKKYPCYLIMKVTGHRSESAFKRYVNISQEEASEIFLKENSR